MEGGRLIEGALIKFSFRQTLTIFWRHDICKRITKAPTFSITNYLCRHLVQWRKCKLSDNRNRFSFYPYSFKKVREIAGGTYSRGAVVCDLMARGLVLILENKGAYWL